MDYYFFLLKKLIDHRFVFFSVGEIGEDGKESKEPERREPF
jgi:hypothetical protein